MNTFFKKNKIKTLVFACFAVILGILSVYSLTEITHQNNYKKIPRIVIKTDNNEANTINSFAIKKENEIQKLNSKKQDFFYFFKDDELKPKISAQSYIVGDLKTGEIILEKNMKEKRPIASVTKLMTAIVALELEKEDTATISKRAVATYGGNGNLQAGEKIKIKDLVYPLLLESSNDSAEAIAEHFERNEFMKKMNQQAEKIKMINTFYDDPSGLSSKNQSTAEDLFKLTGYLNQKKEDILKISKTRSYSTKTHSWFSINQFLGREGYAGGKSGFTNPAGQTVISIFDLPLGQNYTRPIGIVLLKSSDRKIDVDTILSYLKRNVYYGGKSDATSDWIKERLDIPSIREPDYVTFAFLGDIMLDRGVKSSINKNFKGDYSILFEKMGILKKQDIVFANLEGPASDKGKDLKNLYSFRMHPSVIPALAGGGINIVSVANNHAGDWGIEAFNDTLFRLKENEISYAGGGTLSEVENPTIIEKYGIKIGFLGFSDVGPNWLEATTEKQGILLANNPRFEKIIKNASEQVDHLIVSIHFGDEYKKVNNQRQQKLARTAIDNGAKMVIGHHPHVVQNTEIYKNGYIVYSLGNFIFDQKFSLDTMQGMLLEAKLRKNGELSIKKHTVKLNNLFQPDKIILGTEEKIKFK